MTPAAEALGVKLTLHPDDPPRPLFGLPRIASTANDYAALFDAVPSQANGMCFCTGSLGVREDNDLPAIARRFAGRIHFAHLRATAREKDGRSFHESAHLEGDVDMVAVLKELVTEDRRRSGENTIVFRSDHGHRMLDDLAKTVTPGYPRHRPPPRPGRTARDPACAWCEAWLSWRENRGRIEEENMSNEKPTENCIYWPFRPRLQFFPLNHPCIRRTGRELITRPPAAR